jgi:hypothetical protein
MQIMTRNREYRTLRNLIEQIFTSGMEGRPEIKSWALAG